MKTKQKYPLAVLVSGLGLLVGCKSLPPSKPEAELTADERKGEALFVDHCSRCHDAHSTKRIKGPGLLAITKAASMPWEHPATDMQIRNLIQNGDFAMPAAHVTDTETDLLVTYLHTL